MSESQPLQIVEALIFASPKPISYNRLDEITEFGLNQVKKLVYELEQQYEKDERAFRIFHVAEGVQIRTCGEYSEWIKKLEEIPLRKYSTAAIETLSIIAYRQPISKVDIEKIRTVDSSYTLKTLLEKDLIKITGRINTLPGRPNLYGTTDYFLEVFSLNNLQDLPSLGELD